MPIKPEAEFGRAPVQILEIEQDQCALVYGESPCTAALGATGERKCYNTRATCQDPANYDRGTIILRFVKPHQETPNKEYLIPSLRSVSTAPTVLNAGGTDKDSGPLGQRAEVTAMLQDHKHSDLVVDKYRKERYTGAAQADGVGVDPYERGTFWAKWLARNPYYVGRVMRIYEGYAGQDIADMRARTYLIESVNGPDSDGRVRIKGKDALKLADSSRAKVPAPSPGELDAAIGSTDVSITVKYAIEQETYPTGGGVVRIGDEIITYSDANYDAANEKTTLNVPSGGRGGYGTTAEAHDEGDSVQLCRTYDQAKPWEVARDLLVEDAGIPSRFIPFSDWDDEAGTFINGFRVSTVISDPTGVGKLVGEMARDCLFYVWWDERAEEIKLATIRPPIEEPPKIDDTRNIKADSVTLDRLDEDRVSRLLIYYDVRNYAEDLDDPRNFRKLRVRAALNRETDDQYGSKRTKTIYSRWLTSEGQAIALAYRVLARYQDTPTEVSLEMDAKDRKHWTGDVLSVEHRGFVDDAGNLSPGLFQIIEAEESSPGHSVQYRLRPYRFRSVPGGDLGGGGGGAPVSGRYAFISPDDTPTYSNASEEEQEGLRAWIADSTGVMPSDDSGGYKLF